MSQVWADVEGAVKDWLKADAGMLGSPCSGRIYLALPENPTFPCVTIMRIGGGQGAGDTPLDQCLVQFDVRGRVQSLAETELVRQALRSALSELSMLAVPGKAVLGGATVTDDRRFPQPAQQDANGKVGERPRYVITALVTALPPTV